MYFNIPRAEDKISSLLTSRFVPMDVSYPGSDITYPLLVSSYPALQSIRTQQFLAFLSEKLVKTIKMQRPHAQGICVICPWVRNDWIRITLVRGPTWRIQSLTLIISCLIKYSKASRIIVFSGH